MGRPEPCVLYAHTFVHPHLDEYVDEVLFSEPVFITACEFLELNASSVCPAVKLMGATSPPSFALEVFIQCEGEAKFRRLCLPCLYSHSSSNVLEVEAVVTNHLVVRGSYRSLSMVIYGNTAEDLGQFNIEVDLDGPLTDTVTSVEGNLEDLPPAFRPTKLAIDELQPPLEILSQAAIAFNLPLKLRQFLGLVFRTLDDQDLAVAADSVIKSVLHVASSYAIPSTSHKIVEPKQDRSVTAISIGESDLILAEAVKELLCMHKNQSQYRDESESFGQSLFESEAGVPTSKELVDTLHRYYDFVKGTGNVGYSHLSQHNSTILWLSIARLLCSARESCFDFVNYGGMEQLGYAFTHLMQSSTTLTLLLLGVIEQATRYSIGCEGFLGWWPREDDDIPSGISDGYNQLLKLLLENQRHDVASLATYILHRIRCYEVACRYECAVLSVLGDLSATGQVTKFALDMLGNAKLQLKKLLKMLNLSGPIDDPSPVAAASRFQVLGDSSLLAYKSTRDLINLSRSCFSNWDIDSYLLSLLKERGFLPLSAALLSSSALRSERGQATDLFVDIVCYIEAAVLSLLGCRSGLNFLLRDPEVSSMVICALRGVEDVQKEDPVSLRYASVLISKGFFCCPKEVGMIIEMHARALIAVDSLCKLTPNTEEFLWVLWDLCRLSRSECGRQALLVLVNLPEALAVLMTALHSGKELDPASLNTGVSPLNLAIFHSAAEIFEVVVSDSTATSLASWIDNAKELHMALHSSSPGSTKKDAPARLLQWIDASVVYHRNGATGLLRYAAVLASGGDAHMASNSVLASDMMDVDNVVGDTSSGPDGNIIDNLIGKRITEKDFPGVILHDSSVAQLTTAFRILAFISDDPVVAAALYDEGAVMVIHAILINCKLMLERSSNIYDYLVDEGTEGNTTSDLLLERNREKSLIDVLIPSLVLLINLLQKLQETKEQHRNTKLMTALLQLHREVSPKLAACGADLLHSCPDFELGLGAVCHLLASALACWPMYGWTPGLFRFLLDSLHATSLLALGPKEICSLFCQLNYLFPDESIWLWKNGMPALSAMRALAVGTLLGSLKEKQINWYLRPGHPEKLVAQLGPQFPKLGEIVLHCAISMSVVIQDILRVFIIRVSCLSIDNASLLLKPTISWIFHCLTEPSALSNVDAYKVHQLLNFLGILLEHPNAKPLLLKEGGFQMLNNVLDCCIGAVNSNEKHFSENTNLAIDDFSLLNWCVPLFKSVTLISDARTSVQCRGLHRRSIRENLTAEEYTVFWSYLLKFCMVLPVGRELLACLSAIKEMGSSTEGQSALLSICNKHIRTSTVEDSEVQDNPENGASGNFITASEWEDQPPLLCCWKNLTGSIDSKDVPAAQIVEAVDLLASGALGFCKDGNSMELKRVAVIKFLFGVKNENSFEFLFGKSHEHIEELTSLLDSERMNQEGLHTMLPALDRVKETANLLLLLLQKSSGTEEVDAAITSRYTSLLTPSVSSKIHKISDRSMERVEDHILDEFAAKFSWECPENLRDRLTQIGLPLKRKIALEGPSRRGRGDNLVAEATALSTFSRSPLPVTTPSGPSRRDNFRQRKPNTSRPPSMHVDDYVARERNTDGITVQRSGSASGRPPSIHVDEFMARQRERQNVVGVTVVDASAQALKTTAPDKNTDADKTSKPLLKPDLDDDLQGIDIVFDAEESEPDDKLPFPQPDENIPQSSSVVVEQRSPQSVVEETENDVNESSQFSRLGTPLVSIMDENTPSDFSSRISASRAERPLVREPSISSDKRLSDHSEDSKSMPTRTPGAPDSSLIAITAGGAASVYMNSPSHFPNDSRAPHNLYPKANLQENNADQKFSSNPPPLPPMPPPSTVLPVLPQNMEPVLGQSSPFVKSTADLQAPFPPGFHVQSEYMSVVPSSSTSGASPIALQDPKFGRTSLSSPGGSTRPPPPLPPTPPPYAVNSSPLSSLKNSSGQSPQYFQSVSNSELQQTSVAPTFDGGVVNLSASRAMHTSYPTPLMQPLLFTPSSMPISLYGNNLVPHHGDNLPNVSQNRPSFSSGHHVPTVTQLQPLQPPQVPFPPPQHLRPLVPASSQSEQGMSLSQGSLHLPAQSSQGLQHPHASPAHAYYQTQQQETALNPFQLQQVDSQRNLHLPGTGTSQQQDPAMSLQEFFKSPEAIQSLLSDRDKLCQLLEQHPKLMQMLQERLGHL